MFVGSKGKHNQPGGSQEEGTGELTGFRLTMCCPHGTWRSFETDAMSARQVSQPAGHVSKLATNRDMEKIYTSPTTDSVLAVWLSDRAMRSTTVSVDPVTVLMNAEAYVKPWYTNHTEAGSLTTGKWPLTEGLHENASNRRLSRGDLQEKAFKRRPL